MPDRLLVTGSQGTGKTTLAVQAVAAIRTSMIVWVCEPTTPKGMEIADDYRRVATADSLPAFVVLGRAQPDPKRLGHAMCDRHEAAELVAEAGLSVPQAMCAACPFRGECGSRRQAEELKTIEGGAAIFLAAAYLWVPAPDLLIIDERLTIEAVTVAKIPYSALDPYGIPRVPQFAHRTADADPARFHPGGRLHG